MNITEHENGVLICSIHRTPISKSHGRFFCVKCQRGDKMYAVFAMKDNKPIHRQSIITTFGSALLIKGCFWYSGKDYFMSLGYTLAVCLVSETGDPVMYGDSFEIIKEIPSY